MPGIINALEGIATLDDIREAYKIDHPDVYAEVTVAPSGQNHQINVEGRFLDLADPSKQAGRFGRRIEFFKGRFRVYHGIIEIADAYVDREIAWNHYSKALRFYHNVLRADQVYMDADFEGPYAWGDFGFEFRPEDFKLMLSALDSLYFLKYKSRPQGYPETATGLKHTRGPDGYEIGEEAIRAVHEGREHLRMTLDFNDARAVQFLRDEGIL